MFLRRVLNTFPIYVFKFLTNLWLFIENECSTLSSADSYGTQKYCLFITLISGIGSVIFIYGSNVTDIFKQSGHYNVDLYNPCIKSTMIDWFRFKWFIQDSREALISSVPFDSSTGSRGLSFTRFKSSCNPSNNTERSSYESCCSWLLNYFLNFAIIDFKWNGAIESLSSYHSYLISFAYPIASFPWDPKGFV